MSESKHTPGPWAAEFTGPHSDTRDGFWEIGPIGADGLIDWTREVAATADPNEANAHLIAAAPDLLATVRDLVKEIKTFHKTFDARKFVAAERAIAKAERRSL